MTFGYSNSARVIRPFARHTCIRCGKTKFEKYMVLLDERFYPIGRKKPHNGGLWMCLHDSRCGRKG